MTALSRERRKDLNDFAPGQFRRAAAPLAYVTRLSEMETRSLSEGYSPGDQGIYWELIGRAINGAEEFNFGVYSLAPGEYHPRHFHPAGAEFYYVTEGSCVITVGDEDIEATPGTAVYMPPNTVHAVRTRDGERMTMVYAFSCGDARDAGTTWVE